MLVVGIDWADAHHDVILLREGDGVLNEFRVANDGAGYDRLVTQVQETQSTPEEPVSVAIEATNGLLVQRCLAEGYELYKLNPKVVAQYRKQYRPSQAKSDKLDALVLGEMIRDHAERFDPVCPDSKRGRECRILVQDYRKLVQQKTQLMNQLTSSLKQYFPGALDLFTSLDQTITMAFLEEFETLEDAQSMNVKQWKTWLKEHRHPHWRTKAANLYDRLKHATGSQDEVTMQAKRRRTQHALKQLRIVMETMEEYEQRFEELLASHPDGELFESLPGAATVTAAKLMGEFGDNRARYESAQEVQCEAGTAPVTIQSGQTRRVVMRQACRRSFRDTMQQFAFTSLNESEWARKLYDRQRDQGKRHSHALRVVANRWLTIIYTLWKRRECYDEEVHFRNSSIMQESAA